MLSKNNMEAQIVETLPQLNGDSTREGVVECTYTLLQADKDPVLVETADILLSCSEPDVAVVSTSVNKGVHNFFALDNLTAEDQSENCFPHESNETMQSVLLPTLDDILPLKNNGGDEELFKEISASLPQRQQQQSLTPPHNGDPSEFRCRLPDSKSAIKDSTVLRKLARRKRYFDPGNSCSERRAADPSAPKPRKLCYLCGRLQHAAKRCPMRRTCHFCKGKGHFAIHCPVNTKESERICLRCGETGHEIFSCKNDYCPDDLKQIRCYVCNELGHIFCGNYVDESMPTVSCYNCGEAEHSGLQCPKPHLDIHGSKPPSICYKCGEGGHAARKCGKSSEASRGHEGGQGPASHLGAEPDEASVHQKQNKVRRRKAYGRARKRRLGESVGCRTV